VLAVPSAAVLLLGLAIAQAAAARTIENNTPPSIAQAEDLGPATASDTLTVTLWLQAPNSDSAAERRVAQLYDRSSPNFHHWLTQEQADAAFAPSAAQARIVQKFLTDHHLRVAAVDSRNLYVRAQGKVADMENAFHVAIHQFNGQGRTFRSNTSDPQIDEPAGALVAAVSGLSEHHVQPHSVRAVDPETGEAFAPMAVDSGPNGAFFSPQCFRPPQRVNLNTNGGLPSASYFGNRYGADNANTAFGSLPTCGYQPSEMQTAYGLSALYAAGLDGGGETIVIVDAYGSPTIAADAELFSQVYGLPDLTASNFRVYYPGGAPPAPDSGWATETSLDVEWAHAVAPRASIALVIAPTSNDSDLQAAVLFAVRNGLGHVISNSYGEAEGDVPAAELNYWNQLSRMSASRGISVNFSSGDGGDSNPSGFIQNLVLPGVSSPASSPWATAVGGTSLGIDSNNNLLFQTGWGTNLTRVGGVIPAGASVGPPLVPPLQLGFQGGAGGGDSGFFQKPSFQASLTGSARRVPDIAFLADPYTGAEFICDGASCFGLPPGSGAFFSSVGGTSLACPMFSGLWAIASQSAGNGLGDAARLLYSLPAGAISDVVAVGSENNVRGRIQTTSGAMSESSSTLAQPLDNTRRFYSALYQGSSTRWYVLSFGTDSSLTTGLGWDNVTGLGTPNGKAFVDAVVAAARGSGD